DPPTMTRSWGGVTDGRVEDAGLDRADVDLAVRHQHREQAGGEEVAAPPGSVHRLRRPDQVADHRLRVAADHAGRAVAGGRGRAGGLQAAADFLHEVLLRELRDREPASAVAAEGAGV